MDVHSTQARAHAQGADETSASTVDEKVMQAAIRCTEESGLDRVTVDDIVRISGVPRTTLYRRFGGREMILQATIVRLTQPCFDRMAAIAAGPGDLRKRLEEMLVEGIASLKEQRWARLIYERGITNAERSLFASISEASRDSALSRLLEAAMAQDKLRPGISLDHVRAWIVREFLAIAFEHGDDRDVIGEAVRQFMLPVLLCDIPASPDELGGRVARVEASLAGIDLLRRDMVAAKLLPG